MKEYPSENHKNAQSANKKKITPINSNTNYRRETKLAPINMDYCLLKFDALKSYLGVRLQGGSLHNLNFFNTVPPNLITKS